jgi:siroheme synthase
MICDGTLPSQIHLIATLATIGEYTATLQRTGRALFVIGQVVSLAPAGKIIKREAALT